MNKFNILFFITLICFLVFFLCIQQTNAGWQAPAPQNAKSITPTPTLDIVQSQGSGTGISITAIVLFFILLAGFLFGYFQIHR